MNKLNDLLITDRQKIRDYWKKSEEQMKMEIGILKQWLISQKHLPEIPNDTMIEFFLVNCKFSIEKTKGVLDLYYTVRSLIPDLYEDKHPRLQHMKNIFESIYICPLPKLTEQLQRITIIKFKEADTDLFQIENYCSQVVRNIFEIRINEDLNLGEIIIVDFRHVKMGHIIKFSPMIVKKAVFIVEKLWCNRLKGIHYVNCPSYVDTLVTIMRNILSAKLKERLHIHANLEDMYKFFPQDLLPTDYGGKEKSMDEILDHLRLKLEEYYPRFDKMEELKVNETLRPEKLVNSDILGYHGNFRKIDVD